MSKMMHAGAKRFEVHGRVKREAGFWCRGKMSKWGWLLKDKCIQRDRNTLKPQTFPSK